jgi:SAM-dependent methyltransferase
MNLLVNKHTARLLYLAWLNMPFARPMLDRLMRETFDSLAPGWAQRTGWPGRLEPLSSAIEAIEPSPSRIVDLGCGAGEATILLAKRFPSAWVIGVDISCEMLVRAGEAARQAETAIQFMEESIDATTLENATVDLVVLVNAPPPFHEIGRVLAPAGRAVVVYTQGPDTFFYSPGDRLRRGFARAGMIEVTRGHTAKGEYFVAAHAAVTARSPQAGAHERAAQSRVAEASR